MTTPRQSLLEGAVLFVCTLLLRFPTQPLAPQFVFRLFLSVYLTLFSMSKL